MSNIRLPANSDIETLRSALQSCQPGESVSCLTEQDFALAKILLVKEKITDISVQLIDEQGYIVRQVTSKRRPNEPAAAAAEFNDRQLAVIKALEKVLHHCQQQGVRLVGYSDELVAYPATLETFEQASVFALDIDTSGVYMGTDPEGDL